MSLKRKQIRKRLVADLLAAVAAAQPTIPPAPEAQASPLQDLSVFDSRLYNLEVDDMPAVSVYLTGDQDDRNNRGYNTDLRIKTGELTLIVGITPGPEENAGDAMDDLCEALYAAIDLRGKINGLVVSIDPGQTEILFNNKAEVPHVLARISYDVEFLED